MLSEAPSIDRQELCKPSFFERAALALPPGTPRGIRGDIHFAWRHYWPSGLDPNYLYLSNGQRVAFTTQTSSARAVWTAEGSIANRKAWKSYAANKVTWANRVRPARTNLLLQSQTFQTTWANTRSDELTNVVIAPDGTLTADEVVATAVGGTHKIRQSVTKAASAIQYCFSVFVKTADYSKVRLELSNGVESASCFAHFDLVAKTSTTGAATTFTVDGHGIEELEGGTGWFRIWIIGTTDTDTTINVWVQLQQTGGATSWTGNGADGIYVWGAQLETGNYPTDYKPTTTATVSNVADVLRCVSAPIFSPMSEAGALLVVFNLRQTIAADTWIASLNEADDSANNYAAMLVNSSAAIRGTTKNAAGGTTLQSTGVTQAGGTLYAAMVSWKANYIAAAANGTGAETGAGGPPGAGTLDRLEIGGLISTDTRHGAEVYSVVGFKEFMTLEKCKQVTRLVNRMVYGL